MLKPIFSLLIFLTPIFFWTATPNFFNTPKQLLLSGFIILALITIAIHSFRTKSITFSSSPLRFGLYGFALAIILNLGLNASGRLESMLGPGSVYLFLALLSYIITAYADHSYRPAFIVALLGSTAVLALHTTLQLTFLYQLDSLPLFMQARGFTLTGSLQTTLALLILGGLTSLYLTLKHPKFKLWSMISTALHTVAIVALSISLLPGGELALQILPFNASWNIALDAMKNLKSLFFGVGLTQFSNFYKSVKPLFLNSDSFWNILPTGSSSTLLDLLTTTGLVGLLGFLSLPLVSLRTNHHQDSLHSVIQAVAAISFIILSLTQSSLPLLLIFFASLALLNTPANTPTPLSKSSAAIFSTSLVATAFYLFYLGSLFVRAEINLRQAQIALANQDGKKVYEYHLAAIKLLPQMTNYRLSYSQVNLSLASSLSQKKTELSQAERQNITQLISQAVREAKLATSLTPNNSAVWQNLGLVYRNLINVGEGADKFAIDSYAQAVALDPGNPSLRVEFGGMLYQLAGSSKKPEDQARLYGRAQSEFQTAIQLKPNYPNAYYNLAKLLESQGDYQNAVLSLQKSISLLGPDSLDLGKANSELIELQAKLKKPSPTPSGALVSQTSDNNPSLVEPSPLPSPLAGGPVELP